jgi:hypothetical protein
VKKLMLSGIIAVGLLAPGLAFGQEEQQPDKVEYKKKTIIDFSDVTIQGELTKPEGSYLLNRKKTSFRTLLKIRGDFLPELVNSIDSL